MNSAPEDNDEMNLLDEYPLDDTSDTGHDNAGRLGEVSFVTG